MMTSRAWLTTSASGTARTSKTSVASRIAIRRRFMASAVLRPTIRLKKGETSVTSNSRKKPPTRSGSSSPPLLRSRRLRTHPPAIMLDREDVAVEGRGPLLALHGHFEIPQSVADIALDLAPIELRIAVDHVGRTGIAKLLVNAGFDEFVVERVQFARVERIAQLTDQIAGPDQARIRVGRGV